MSKVVGIYVKFWHVLPPNMVMSRDSTCKYSKIFNFVLILHLILGKVTKFPVEKLSTLQVMSQKAHEGVLGVVSALPPLSTFRVNRSADSIRY